jgi:hypothetical protein
MRFRREWERGELNRQDAGEDGGELNRQDAKFAKGERGKRERKKRIDKRI